MLNRRPLLLLALVVVLGAFSYGVVQLFSLRFAAGDVYPPYSSLRGDPLGCRIYYESLDQLGEGRVRRFLQPLNKLPDGRGTTLFMFGLPWNEMTAEPDEYQALEEFTRRGGRLVIALYPELGKPRYFDAGPGTNRAAFKPPPKSRAEQRLLPVNLREKWGFGYGYIQTASASSLTAPLVALRHQPGPFPTNLSWHSALVFTNLDPAWRVLYARGTNAVLIERAQGDGSIVLATDSYFTSNEAMRQERAADLLAWLTGRDREIIFDETHLGVREHPGIATLARRYGLLSGVIALLVLAALFIWKNSVSFLPRPDTSAAIAPVLGRESAAGLENLLRRGIAPKNLLQTALDEWHKASSLDRRATPPRREKIRAVVEAFNAAEKPDVVQAYREIAEILNRKT